MATSMPTGAKATGGLAFAVVGWLVANAYVPNMPEAEPMGFFREMVAALGLITGWKVMGSSVGGGYIAAAGAGMKTVLVLIFWALLLFSTYEMLLQSVKMVYDGPMDAVLDIFKRMYERAQPLLATGVVTIMVGGGMVGGILAENANRRWP